MPNLHVQAEPSPPRAFSSAVSMAMVVAAWERPRAVAGSLWAEGAGRTLGAFPELSEPEDNQHYSWTMCSRECISAPSEHTQRTQQR